MIKKIILKNFMPYRSAEVDVDCNTVAVVGENGHGKSVFLEAVPYAYFGIGRSGISGMSRLLGDGSHAVEVHEESSKGSVVIRRGCKPSGIGFCSVHLNGDLVGKGKEATAWIEDYLGMDADTYMLTAFFGLKDTRHDVLINVLPSVRLEALQKLAKIGPYRTFELMAKNKMTGAQTEMDMAVSRADGAEAALVDVDVLNDVLLDKLDIEKDIIEDISVLKSESHNLRVEEERYQAFVKEKERLSVERKSIGRDIKNCEDEIDTLTHSINEDAEIIDADILDKKSNLSKLAGIDVDEYRSVINIKRDKISELRTMADLKKTAMGVSSEKCPLCGADLLGDTITIWESDIKDMESSLIDFQFEIELLDTEVLDAGKLERSIADYKISIGLKIDSLKEDRERLIAVKRDVKKYRDDKEHKDGRYLDLAEKLGEDYQGLQSQLSDISDKITDTSENLGVIRGEISSLREQIKGSIEGQKIVNKSRKESVELRGTVAACKLLRDAWNRYGIPLSLVHGIARQIEDRASMVYQSFDNGRIEVREVEDRGKPGIQFYLVDRKGERTYGQLSEGEKVMFFVAVRVAIAHIVSEEGVSVDYLIFDEAMGNLSPKRRDDLIRLINKVLRKSFPQVFMVSHTEMRDIFTQTLKVSDENGESKIQVA